MKNFFLVHILLLFTLLTSLVKPQQAYGQGYEQQSIENSKPYLFTGPCSSQGAWTQDALTQTNRLREITIQLRDDPNCKALGESLDRSFVQIQGDLDNMHKGLNGNDVNATYLRKEIQALREADLNNPNLQPIIYSNMLTKLFKFALIKSGTNEFNSVNPSQLTDQQRSELISSFGDRMNRVASRGFSIFNQVIDSLPANQACLMKSNATGQLLSASVSMLGALASSGEDALGSQTARSIAKLSSVMRSLDFAGVLKKLNQQEFMASIQCIMETTSDSFCSARDSRILYAQMKEQQGIRNANIEEQKKSPVPSQIKFENPLYGFYVLTHFSPLITDWLFRIQIGSNPKVQEDGEYKIRILRDMQGFLETTVRIQGAITTAMDVIKGIPELETKKTYALDLIFNITALLLPDNGPMGGGNRENFFRKAGSPVEIPFKLIGMEVPDQVRLGGDMQSPRTWFNNNYRSIPLFNSPDAIPDIISANLSGLMDSANSFAINYYNERFVADPIGLVGESYVGLPYSTLNALQNIDGYLQILSNKLMNQQNIEKSLLGMIDDTRMRLGKIFYRYNDLTSFVEKNKNISESNFTQEKEQDYKINFLKKNIDLISEIYTQFNILQAKSGLLAKRLITLVQWDFQNYLRNSIHESTEAKDLLYKEIAYASGKMLYDRLQQMAGSNPTLFNLDLDSALRIYKENLAAQEMLLSGSFISILAQLKLAANKPYFDSRTVTLDSVKRAWKDGWQKTYNDDRNAVTRFLSGVWNSLKTLPNPVTTEHDHKYPVNFSTFLGIKDDTIYSVDDEFHSARNLFNRMCIQGLTFISKENMRSVYNLCKNVILRSPFDINEVPGELKNSYNDYLSINFAKKLSDGYKEDYRLNHSNRICAFRDYNRRNLVVNLTVNLSAASRPENNYSANASIDYSKFKQDPKLDPANASAEEPPILAQKVSGQAADLRPDTPSTSGQTEEKKPETSPAAK